MGDGGPLQIACFLVGADTSSGAHPRDDGARLQEDGHALCCCGDSQMVRDLGYECFCLHEDKEGVLQLLLDKVARECRPEGRDWQILRQMSPTEPSEQWSRGESRLHSAWTCQHKSGSSQRQNPVF